MIFFLYLDRLTFEAFCILYRFHFFLTQFFFYTFFFRNFLEIFLVISWNLNFSILGCETSQCHIASILLYGCTTWSLTKRLEKKLDGNYTRILRAILNKSWRQHPTRHQLYGHLPPITKTIQVRRTRHAGHCYLSIMQAGFTTEYWEMAWYFTELN